MCISWWKAWNGFKKCSPLATRVSCMFKHNAPSNSSSTECCITGDIPCFVEHLKADHNVDMHDGSTFNHRYMKPNPHKIENARWMLTGSLRHFIWAWYWFTWHFCILWATEMMSESSGTVSRLLPIVEN